jgi:hypothetical protein
VNRLGVDAGGSISERGKRFFLYATGLRPTFGLNKPPIQWVLGALLSGVMRLGREANHSPPSSAEVARCLIN